MAQAPEKMSSPDEQSVDRVKEILSIIGREELLGTLLEHDMTDDVLIDAETKEEMQSWLEKIVRCGVAIKFSVKWFKRFKQTTAPTTDLSGQSAGATAEEGKVMGTSNNGEEPHTVSSHSVSEDNSSRTRPQVAVNVVSDDNQVSDNAKHEPGGTKAQHKNKTDSLGGRTDHLGANRLQKEQRVISATNASLTQKTASVAVTMDATRPVQNSSQAAETSTAETMKYTRRPFGEKDFKYSEGEVILGEENAEIEFKSLTKENPVKLPWKIMEKARPFLCGVLNAGGSGVIYFGIGDSYDESTKFTRGEVIGLDVENLKDEIIKAFQFTLDDHIQSNDGKLQKAGDMGCIKIFFVPVYEADKPTGRYVVELEVKRDWQHCKKNVYYHQSWKEKRGDCKKVGLHDLYKVDKDDWQDPVVRTCGATRTVKHIEVEKQIRAPLSQKYNAFKNQEKKSFLSTTPLDIDGADVQNFSSNLGESLRELNLKEFSYILIANKISQKYRGTDTLAFLQSVPWMAVFDLFDPGSWKDGLHYIFSETSNSFQASFKDLSKLQDDIANENFPARGTTWVERNEEMAKRDWIRYSKSLLNHALSACKEGTPTGRLHIVFLLSSNENVVEMADMMETAFSILGEKASKSITIISEETQVVDEIIKNSKQDVRNDVKRQSYSGKRWDLIKNIFEQLLPRGSIDSNPQAKTALPYFDGKLKDVLTGILNSLTDLEIYLPNPKIHENVEEIKKAKNDFYKGGSVNQVNLFHRHDIDRTLQKRLIHKIDRCLKKLSEHSELAATVEVVQLRYESGSGATTLCRRILWNKKDTYRCAEVKAITGVTVHQIEQLHNLSYVNLSQCYIPPVLVLVDNFSDQDVRQLHNKISESMITCVILNTIPISKSQNSNKEFLELRQLDRPEILKVKGILEHMTTENKKMCKAEEVLERDRRFLWLGLELFGRKYQDVDRKVANQIEDMIAQNVTVDSEYRMILNFCCLLDSYSWGRCNYPHAIVSDLLCTGKGDNDIADLIPELHEKYGGLLLETQDERNGNWCWRPAHYLVGEIVKNKMDLIVTTKHFLKTMNDGNAYAIKFLRDHAVTICLDRLSTTTSPVSSNDEDLEDALIVNDTCSGLKVRSKYSPLIQDVIELASTRRQGIENALDILVTLCENVKTIPHKARTWQQIARIIAYELGASDVTGETGKIRYLNDLLRPTEKATKGFEIAHLVIDEAIRLQGTNIHHFTAKGAFFLCELNQIKERLHTPSQQITAIVKEAINTGRKGVEMYENALQKIPSDSYGYLDVLVGKFVAVVKLLEVLKCLPYFKEHSLGQDKSFSEYMHGKIPHKELSAIFDTRVSEYLVSLKDVAADLSIDLSQEVHFVKLRHPDVSRKYLRDEVRNVRIRASEITKKFYCLIGWDEWDQTNVPPCGGYEELTSYCLLSKRGETAFSSWKTLSDDDVQKIHDSLQPTIRNQKHRKRNASMLIFAKALLHSPEKTSFAEFSEHVNNWCQMFSSSVWAHFFNYMIHFPPRTNSPFVEDNIKYSIEICTAKSRSKQRRSGAEYFLGKGVGLKAIVRACEFEIITSSDEIYGTKFWQSPEVFMRLKRLQGRKTGKGLLCYKGIEIKFDNKRYPKDSDEELWFYLGFTLSGPYAFDPVDKNSYENLKATLSEAEVMDKNPSTDKKSGASATSYSQRPTKISKSSNQRASVPKDESNKPKVPSKVGRNQGGDQHCFPFTRFDSYGRTCYGAQVKAARKSVDCYNDSKGHNIETCSFAHYARGDTLQHVCRKCTKNHKQECTEKKNHQEDIYNLGPFLDQSGNVWVKHA